MNGPKAAKPRAHTAKSLSKGELKSKASVVSFERCAEKELMEWMWVTQTDEAVTQPFGPGLWIL